MNKIVKNVGTVYIHTGNLLENKNKIKERDICENASNFGVQLKKEKQNNITTFEKNKSNVVGVGIPDDPDAKNKHTNKTMSNIPTSNTAITLIALIITIIVLLILAGITLNMVMGENGIFGKANNAKNKTEVAQYEEELRMCVLELQTDSAANGTTFNVDTIRNNLDTYTQKLYDETIEWKEKDIEESTGIYKGYNFYIDKKYGAHITDKATGTQISMKILREIPETGYTNQDVNLKITITNNEKGINKIIKPDGKTENLNGAKTYEEEKTATENTKYTYVVTDTEGKEETKEVEIKIIDKNAPEEFTITAENTEEGLKIIGTATDTESGIEKYEYYVKKSGDTEFTNKGTENPIKNLEAGTYSVYAIAYDKAGNKKSSNTEEVEISRIYSNITAKMVAENPEKYYGLKVTNYESQNGQNDWKIFYSDWKEKSIEQNTDNPTDTHIFLITGDYINTAEKDRIDIEANIDSAGTYKIKWQKTVNFQEIQEDVKTRFQFKDYELNSSYNTSKCTSSLLYTEYWKKYLDKSDKTGKAEFAIGGSTIEMWVNSWNNLYKNIDGELYCNKTSKNGYYVGTENEPTTTSISSDIMKLKKGYNNKLYYPRTSNNSNGASSNCCFASPSASYALMLYVSYNGNIGSTGWSTVDYSLRPVVSLKDGSMVDATDPE